MFNMFDMLGKLGNIKERIQVAKERLKATKLEETGYHGHIRVKMTANLDLEHIEVDEQAKELPPEELSKHLTDTVKNAMANARARAKEEVNRAKEGTIPDLPGFEVKDMPFF